MYPTYLLVLAVFQILGPLRRFLSLLAVYLNQHDKRAQKNMSDAMRMVDANTVVAARSIDACISSCHYYQHRVGLTHRGA